jgi:hypothetical protein
MALDTEQRPDAPTQASPSRPPDRSTVKQWKQHTRHGAHGERIYRFVISAAHRTAMLEAILADHLFDIAALA